jgi:hypothetical protein
MMGLDAKTQANDSETESPDDESPVHIDGHHALINELNEKRQLI